MPSEPVSLPHSALGRARTALVLLLVINLFNYIDRQILAALEKPIADELGASMEQMGRLVFAFLISYMLLSPVFGFVADRFRRWIIIGVGVILWSLASGGTGLAYGYSFLLLMRCLIGVGEAAYGPVAPTLIADLYPIETRGKVLAWFYAAIPVGSALGYTIGGLFAANWHWAFFLTVPPGILLGIWCFLMPEPPRRLITDGARPHKPRPRDYLRLLRTRSYVLNCLGMTAMTFAIGGIAFWMPRYLVQDRGLDPARSNMIFGAIVATAGLLATLAGGWLGDRLRPRLPGSYMLVSAAGMLVGFPLFLLMLVTPFPACWGVVFAACFCLFFNTGPSNTALANVTHPSIRATAFALNIFVIHALGDAISPAIIGRIADAKKTATSSGLTSGFVLVSLMMLVGGLLWLWAALYLPGDERRA
ncbi:MAG: MFS transporter, partial [Phycisphaerae bacterium]|nr:MFS transporter [Phycisphaerae bacterium]MDW8263054.1 MFS transporter [Phycisphaerales bacterium]